MELGWVLVGFYGALVIVVLIKALPTFRLREGMLTSAPTQQRQQAQRRGQPLANLERVQAMVMTLATVGLFGYWGGQNIAANTGTLPDIPMELLAAFGTSQVIYVGGKLARKRGWI